MTATKRTDERGVAIVGAAFELPGASTWVELSDVLRHGRDLVRRAPARRLQRTGVVPGPDARDVGWLEDVSAFDFRFFGLSRADAELTDPRQRRLMTLAVQAIGEAGYAPDALAGTRTAVIVAALGSPRADLYDQLMPEDRALPSAFTGSLHACLAGRIAYHLDLRGGAMTIDTACSSFLTCLHEACGKLQAGDVDLVLAGAYSAVLGAPPARVAQGGVGVESPNARSRPFDADADGAGVGEGGGVLVLKRVSDAWAANDNVQGVILGSAVNHDGHRSNGMAAPSPEAQTDVLVAAWERAGVSGADLGYLEAHGTGTKIGDPIEIQGMVDAFARSGRRQSPCPVSSIKGNLGHLGSAAGLAGVLRVLAQLHDSAIYPTAHFRAESRLLPPHGRQVRVTRSEEPWPLLARGRRVAGASSFGLSGTNVHVVLADGWTARVSPTIGESHLVPVSARSPALLIDVVRRLAERTNGEDFVLGAVASVLRGGRRAERFRRAWVVASASQLRAHLLASLDELPAAAPGPSPVVLAVGRPPAVSADVLRSAGTRSLAAAYRLASVSVDELAPRQRGLVWQVVQHDRLCAHEVPIASVLGHGPGRGATRVMRGDVTLSAALDEVAHAPVDDDGSSSPAGLSTALAAAGTRPLIIDLAPGSTFSTTLAALETDSGVGPVLPVAPYPDGLLDALKALYLDGHRLNWTDEPGHERRAKVAAPLAELDEEPCWPPTADVFDLPNGPHTSPRRVTIARSPRDALLAHARRILKDEELTLDSDFFAHGGDSLNGARVLAALNEECGSDLQIDDLLGSSTLGDLPLPPSTPDRPNERDSSTAPASLCGPLTGQQLAIWAALGQHDETVGPYNVPGAFVFDHADVDPASIHRAIELLVNRQPMLRSVLVTGGVPSQQVLPHHDVVLEGLPVTLDPSEADDFPRALTRVAQDLVAAPLSPGTVPPARWWLVDAIAGEQRRRMLVMNFHHLFFDGWSWRLVFADAWEHRPPPDDDAYLDFVAHQQTVLHDRGEALEEHWSAALVGAPPKLDVAGALGEPGTPGSGGATEMFQLDAECVARLRIMARSERATLSNALTACWVMTLWRATAERDIVLAMNVAGRRPRDEKLIGCFVNTVLVRCRLDPFADVRALLRVTREATLAALRHAELPYNRILHAWQAQAGGPVEPASMFDFQPQVDRPTTFAGASGELLVDVTPPGTKQTLSLTCVELGAVLHGSLEYEAERVASGAARRLAASFGVLLRDVVDSDGRLPLVDVGAAVADAPDFQPPARDFIW